MVNDTTPWKVHIIYRSVSYNSSCFACDSSSCQCPPQEEAFAGSSTWAPGKTRCDSTFMTLTCPSPGCYGSLGSEPAEGRVLSLYHVVFQVDKQTNISKKKYKCFGTSNLEIYAQEFHNFFPSNFLKHCSKNKTYDLKQL